MKEKDMKWKTLKSEYVIRRPWLTARRDMVKLPTGVVNDEYYVLEYPDWVNIIAITREGQFVFVRQYRYALGETSFEICAGPTSHIALLLRMWKRCRDSISMPPRTSKCICSAARK